jgi:hypothetical protein
MIARLNVGVNERTMRDRRNRVAKFWKDIEAWKKRVLDSLAPGSPPPNPLPAPVSAPSPASAPVSAPTIAAEAENKKKQREEDDDEDKENLPAAKRVKKAVVKVATRQISILSAFARAKK